MCRKQIILSLLRKILQTVERILANSETINSPSFYLLTPSGMERLESTCMLLIAIGEGVKGVDKLTEKNLFSQYPGIDCKRGSQSHLSNSLMICSSVSLNWGKSFLITS